MDRSWLSSIVSNFRELLFCISLCHRASLFSNLHKHDDFGIDDISEVPCRPRGSPYGAFSSSDLLMSRGNYPTASCSFFRFFRFIPKSDKSMSLFCSWLRTRCMCWRPGIGILTSTTISSHTFLGIWCTGSRDLFPTSSGIETGHGQKLATYLLRDGLSLGRLWEWR